MPQRLGLVTMSDQYRMLLIHAHPDDETITCGATMARAAAQGTQVVLLTCTLGEEGEVLLPDLVHLAADRADTLGAIGSANLRTRWMRWGCRTSESSADQAGSATPG